MSLLRLSAAPEPGGDANWRLYGETARDALTHGVDLANGAVDLGEVARPDSRYLDVIGGPIHAHLEAMAEAEGLGDPAEPIVVFINGFQFDPRIKNLRATGKSSNPHAQLYHFTETPLETGAPGYPGSDEEHESHATPWLRRAARSGDGDGFDGLAIAFAYESWGGALNTETPSTLDLLGALTNIGERGGRIRNTYARAFIDADMAADTLAGVLTQLDAVLRARGDDRPIDLFAHSLGARTALLTLERLAQRHPKSPAFARIGRSLLLAGSASWLIGARILKTLRAARPEAPPEIFNFTSSSDDVIALLGARAALRATDDESEGERDWLTSLARFIRGGEVIGRDGRPDLSADLDGEYLDWADVALDHGETQAWAASHGLRLVGDRKGFFDILDHWVHYTEPSNWELYRRILYSRETWTARAINARFPPAGVT